MNKSPQKSLEGIQVWSKQLTNTDRAEVWSVAFYMWYKRIGHSGAEIPCWDS